MKTSAISETLLPNKRAAKKYSLEEFLRKEETANFKSEFHKGQIIRMPGGSFKHNEIANNISTALKYAIKISQLKLRVTNSDQKIYIPSEEIVVYPDALVISEQPVYWNNRKDLITNPLLIVEVLSKSTKLYDRGEKFMHYRSLASFKEYVLVEQDKNEVEVWFKTKENTWEINKITDIQVTIPLQSIGISISMSDIYDNVDEL